MSNKLQFEISDLFDDVKINITDICRETGTTLNTNLQSYEDIPIKQLFSRVRFNLFSDDYFDYTEIVENSMDKVSERLYDNPNCWWLILLVNGVRNPFAFNMSPRMISIVANYLFRVEQKYTEDTYYDLVNEYNQNRRKKVKFIKKDHLNDFFRKALNG